MVLHNNTNSNVCAVQKETEFHTAVLDRRGAVVVLCIVEGIIEMELNVYRVRQCGMYCVRFRILDRYGVTGTF